MGILFGLLRGERGAAVPDLYPDPPWLDDLTDAGSLGWEQTGSETNVGVFGVSGFALTVQSGNQATLAPQGAIDEYASPSVAVDSVVKGTMTPAAGATAQLIAGRIDLATGNGYSASLSIVESTGAYALTIYRLASWAGTSLATVALDPSVAWGGVWLKVEASGSDTRVRAYALHSDATWRLLLDHTDLDASDDDNAGDPVIGMVSTGASTAFALTAYESTYDATKTYTETVMWESSFTGAAGSINGLGPDTTGLAVAAVSTGTLNRNGSGRLIPAVTGANHAYWDVGAGANKVASEIQLVADNNQDRIGVSIAAADADNRWTAYYSRAAGTDKFALIERLPVVGVPTSVVRAGSGGSAAIGSGAKAMSIEIAADELSITAALTGFSDLTYTPGGAITRHGTKAGVITAPAAAPGGTVGWNDLKVTP